MKREFMIERQGRSFVLYAGLLNEAHQNGLKAIRTQVVQAPSNQNGNLAICFAEVETERGTFTGIGDASPDNVGRAIAPHFVRMAETRAKARALRDAINVGAVAVEELGDLDEAHAIDDQRRPSSVELDAFAPRGREPATRLAESRGPHAAEPTPLHSPAGVDRGDGATRAQIRAIYLIGRDQHGLSDAEIDERSVSLYGAAPADLTKKQASSLITAMKSGSQSAAS